MSDLLTVQLCNNLVQDQAKPLYICFQCKQLCQVSQSQWYRTFADDLGKDSVGDPDYRICEECHQHNTKERRAIAVLGLAAVIVVLLVW